MKKQFLCLIAVSAICSSYSIAQLRTENTISTFNNLQNSRFHDVSNRNTILVNLSNVFSEKNNALQSLPFTNRFVVLEGGFNNIFNSNTHPFVYDPISQTLAIIYNKNLEVSGVVQDTLFYFISTNNGTSWQSNANILSTSNEFLVAPQMALGNPDNSTKFSDLSIISFSRRYVKKQPINQYLPDGGTLMYKVGTDIINISQTANLYGPNKNNSSGYGWGAGLLHKYHNAIGDGMVLAGMLSPTYNTSDGQASIQYGQYGVLSTKSVIEADNDIIGTIPQTWNNSQFLAGNSLGSSYNGPMYSGTDDDGNIYACTNSVFADDKDNRTIAYSKSTNRGETWTTYVRAPASAFEAYGKSRGGDNAVLYRPYQQAAFVVTGNNQFSYFTRMYIVKGTDNQIVAQDIVEISHNNGNWTIMQVSPFEDNIAVFNLEFDSTVANKYDRTYSTIDESDLGNEIEVALTADKKNIVVKWVDYNKDLGPIVISPKQVVYQRDRSTRAI
ncbi:MAG: hypothetical protein JNJ85_01055, partial [Candidatus Kapabacteria bacterium]|nr:hypothetical protein [Candidatus Kapabacteria bacterium]